MNMTIEQFCDKHAACAEGRAWALATEEPDMAALWNRTDIKPEWRVWIATRPGVLDDRTLRLFGCWSVRQVWHLLTDDCSRNAVEVAERFAKGTATAKELAAASDAAGAALASVWTAAWADWATWAAARAARAASASARDTAWATACAAQSSWLIENTKPSFESVNPAIRKARGEG